MLLFQFDIDVGQATNTIDILCPVEARFIRLVFTNSIGASDVTPEVRVECYGCTMLYDKTQAGNRTKYYFLGTAICFMNNCNIVDLF